MKAEHVGELCDHQVLGWTAGAEAAGAETQCFRQGVVGWNGVGAAAGQKGEDMLVVPQL